MGKDQYLLEAARNGNIELVGKLLEQIAKRSGPLSSFRRSPSINTQDVNGYTPLHHACLNGHSNIVRLLLSHGAQIDVPDIRGSTPLYLAAWAGHQEIVKQLLMYQHKPANPNAQTIDNDTPLHCAAQHGHNAALAILLAYGADPTIRNNSFQTALDLAAQFGRLQSVQILIRTHAELIEPFRLDATNTVDSSSPPYITTPTRDIFTHSCLHLASRNGHKKVVETLLAAGINVNILTHAGTALHEAALCGKKSVVITLLEAGVDTTATDGSGRTALDILKDYPPHVTYDIVSIINDFCKQHSNGTHFTSIVSPRGTEECNTTDADDNENENSDEFASENYNIRDKSHSMPKSVYEKHKNAIQQHMEDHLKPKNKKSSAGLSNSLNSLEKSAKQREHYLKMKPIMWQKSTTDISSCIKENGNGNVPAELSFYKPVYKQPVSAFLNSEHEQIAKGGPKCIKTAAKLPTKSYEFMCLARTASESESNSTENSSMGQRRYHCVDEYVKMTEPAIFRQSISSKGDSLTPTQKKPLPSPRTLTSETGDYANINSLAISLSLQNKEYPRPPKRSPPSTAIDVNNNNNTNNHSGYNDRKHSPTPEFPPPSVTEAEHTILEYIQPLSLKKNKRKSLRIENNSDTDLETFILETINQLDSPESMSSRVSDCVEEFVGDRPFAGLFKGSSLNLTNDDNIEYSGLRSPSLVKSIKPMPAKRNIIERQMNIKSNGTEDYNESKVWDEINTILESIGNEVSNVANNNVESVEVIQQKDAPVEAEITSMKHEDTLHIRTPADLVLGIPKDITTNWCHSPNTLIYGQILYELYYLGSTIIKQLHGTASTRKSIQRFKRDDTPPMTTITTTNENEQAQEQVNLLEGCNNFTKFLKSNKQQTRLKVGIALSYIGVKFIDCENKSTICIHDIENINCVCQDAEDLRYFAYITKEHDIHYCHVFMVDNLDLAREIILTLGEAFEVAYQFALNKQKTNIGNGNTNINNNNTTAVIAET